MIRVTFDPYYVDDLQDYYSRNECIREQQYLSPEKLLHLAAFCISRVATNSNINGQPRRHGPRGGAALDAVGQFSLLIDDANPFGACPEPVMIISGQRKGTSARTESNVA